MESRDYIAHVRSSDKERQALVSHLLGVSRAAANNAKKLGVEHAGELLGLLHDLGKYSDAFQRYISSASGLLNPDCDGDYVDAGQLKGKIDHSTAGAQILTQLAQPIINSDLDIAAIQLLALCLVSHHSGLIDCITPDGRDQYSARLEKHEEATHVREAKTACDSHVISRVRELLLSSSAIIDLQRAMRAIFSAETARGCGNYSETTIRVKMGIFARLLLSCLVDADHTDSADFEEPKAAGERAKGRYASWSELVSRLECELATFPSNSPVDSIRGQISASCKDGARRPTGLYTLSVPTGGGKTLASLRFALHHAQKHNLDRVIYVVPYTSIIEQNAGVARKILEPKGSKDKNVLEIHSNLLPKNFTWQSKLLSQNWDAPIVFITAVQFLEAMFGSGTRNIRKAHQLARSVIIFDEIQSLPVRCVHLFCSAASLLVDVVGSTVLLCTATQPLLGAVDPQKGRLDIQPQSELIPDVAELFYKLKRVEVLDKTKTAGWTYCEIAGLVREELELTGSCLVIVNTKEAARVVYQECVAQGVSNIYHLSTNMCPAHRKTVLEQIKLQLGKTPVVCIATQLIEAGVDIDFSSVIRFLAGLDSIAQAAGRCNRNGKSACGRVTIVNPAETNYRHLRDIKVGIDISSRILAEYRESPDCFDHDVIGHQAMARYYQYYFYRRQDEMSYSLGPHDRENIGQDDNLLNMLSDNKYAVGEFCRVNHGEGPKLYFRQSFKTSAEVFEAIDSVTRGVVVPYTDEGKQIIGELCSVEQKDRLRKVIAQAQRFSVNLFPYQVKNLLDRGQLYKAQENVDVYYLADGYYDSNFGIKEGEGQQEISTLIFSGD